MARPLLEIVGHGSGETYAILDLPGDFDLSMALEIADSAAMTVRRALMESGSVEEATSIGVGIDFLLEPQRRRERLNEALGGMSCHG